MNLIPAGEAYYKCSCSIANINYGAFNGGTLKSSSISVGDVPFFQNPSKRWFPDKKPPVIIHWKRWIFTGKKENKQPPFLGPPGRFWPKIPRSQGPWCFADAPGQTESPSRAAEGGEMPWEKPGEHHWDGDWNGVGMVVKWSFSMVFSWGFCGIPVIGLQYTQWQTRIGDGLSLGLPHEWHTQW